MAHSLKSNRPKKTTPSAHNVLRPSIELAWNYASIERVNLNSFPSLFQSNIHVWNFYLVIPCLLCAYGEQASFHIAMDGFIHMYVCSLAAICIKWKLDNFKKS